MKCLVGFFIVFSLAYLSGCASSYKVRTDEKNYREKISISKFDTNFVAAEYAGSDEKCFPPVEYGICKNDGPKDIYRKTKDLKMELFKIKIEDNSSGVSKVVDDMVHLVAADLAKQRGFKTFTFLDSESNYSCVTIRSVNTYGTLSGSSYTGYSQISDDDGCYISYEIIILLFDDSEVLKDGVFTVSRDGKLNPYESLYVGTTPDLRQKRLERSININRISKNTRIGIPHNAYKTYYKVDKLSYELKKQYKITDNRTYSFEDLGKKEKNNVESEVDVTKRFKVIEK